MTLRTVQPSGGDFTTLAAAAAAAVTVAGDILEISGDWSATTDTGAVSVSDTNLTIRTKAGDQARHAGFDNGGSNYELAVSGAHCITVNNDGCIIDGLIIKQAGTGASDEGVRMTNDGGTLTLKNTIVWTPASTSQQDGVYVASIDVTIVMEQCYAYGFNRAGFHAQDTNNAPVYTLSFNSCGFWDNGQSSGTSGGDSGGGIKIAGTTTGSGTTLAVHNTFALENDTGSGSNSDYKQGQGNANIAWSISFSIDSDNSIASQDTGGSGNLASRILRDSTAGGNEVLILQKIKHQSVSDGLQADHALSISGRGARSRQRGQQQRRKY